MSKVPLYPQVDKLGLRYKPVNLGTATSTGPPNLISQKLFRYSFCKRQIPHKSVDKILYYQEYIGWALREMKPLRPHEPSRHEEGSHHCCFAGEACYQSLELALVPGAPTLQGVALLAPPAGAPAALLVPGAPALPPRCWRALPSPDPTCVCVCVRLCACV